MKDLNGYYGRLLPLDFKLPPINRDGGTLNERWFELLLLMANNMPSDDRSQFFLAYDYNPNRFEYIKQVAYIANYIISTEIMKPAQRA